MKIYSEQEFSYVVSSITGYTDQVGGELLAKALIGATTPKYSSVRLGIKGTQALNLLDSNPTFQAGACSLSTSGTTTFTQRNITTCPETLFESLCYKQLYPTYQSMLMNAGQTSETVPFEQQIADLKIKQIQQRIEDQLWNATTVGGSCFNGLDYLITSGNTGIGVSLSGTAFNSTAVYGANGNPITEVDKLINALDDNAMSRDDLVVFMSYANWRLYLQALTRANFFANYIGTSDITNNMEAVHPNTNVKVVPTLGLNGKNKITIGPKEYTVVGFDLTSDHEKMDMWYSKDFDEIRFRANYNYGVQIAQFGSTKYFATNGLS
ncbi:hypothetical protein UFOVP185_34 [uncultured Caudovirales phage]|uniref:Uncharacterized protein n=1 Tax=uncultured Caudovirales phage TaxID=2100421 RepID=A0A6J7WGY0_9CAUD|nr:hypothetical protein UFOVP185_34 [uncultured Caudovirales phage]